MFLYMNKNRVLVKFLWTFLFIADFILLVVFANMLYKSVNEHFSQPDVSLAKITTAPKLPSSAKNTKPQNEQQPEVKVPAVLMASQNETFKATAAATIVQDKTPSAENVSPSSFISDLDNITSESENSISDDVVNTKADPVVQNTKDAVKKAKPVKFTYTDLRAKKVEISGSFISWTKRPMRKKGNTWEIDLYMFGGNYTYHFIVDGQRTADPSKPARRDGDSLITVPI